MVPFNDPDFPAQAAGPLGPGGIDTTPLYAEGLSGAGLRIGVVDSGINWNHPDLIGQVDTAAGWNAITRTPDASSGPREDPHGTTAALYLASRADNGTGGVGVAWGATVVPFKFGTEPTALQQLDILERQKAVDISSNSWGVFPLTDNFLGAYAAQGAAIAEAATVGRGGLGTVIVRSSGNNATDGDDNNARNYANNRFTMTVGAVDGDGVVQDFSTRGTATWAAAPASATSWAVPMLSGTVALMLEANPGLGYRDVQAIIALSARPAGGPDPVTVNAAAGFLDGGGFATSRGAGFGIVDAHAAVRLAETWEGPAQTEANILHAAAAGPGGFLVPDLGAGGSRVSIAEDFLVERAVLTLDVQTPLLGALRVFLVSPSGTESLLLDRMGSGTFEGPGRLAFQFTSAQFFRETSRGDWTLRVEDTVGPAPAAVFGWSLDLYGAPDGPDDTYVYTDAFAARSAADPSRRVLSDPDGGIDGLNAAAVGSASVLDLTPGGAESRIAGVALSVAPGTVIEKAWGGDGDDTLIGHAGDHTLDGGRGFDVVGFGDAAGPVSLRLAEGLVLEDGFGGQDRLAGIEGASGSAFGDRFDGRGANDLLDGRAGQDTLLGLAGDDLLRGGPGEDSLDGGEGADIAFYAGNRADFAVTGLGGGVLRLADRRSGHEGADTVVNVELFQFDDGAASLAELLGASRPSPGGPPNSAATGLDIFRFYNTATATHFYTSSAEERDYVIRSFGQFRFEGNAFEASADPSAGLAVHRFYNTATGGHFYTASAAERDQVAATLPQFAYEGVAYHAWATDGGGARTALYRFYNVETATHFYTTSAEEKAWVEQSFPQYRYEAVAYYVDAVL